MISNFKKALFITILLLLILFNIACPQPGPDDGNNDDNDDDMHGEILFDPDYPVNVNAVLVLIDNNAYVTVTWDGNANDGSYSVVWGTDDSYGNQPSRIENAVSPTQCTLITGEYANYYFWVVCVDAAGEFMEGWESAAAQNYSDPVSYSEAPAAIGAPELIIKTETGLRIFEGDYVKTNTGIGIIPDIPDSSYSDIEFQYDLDSNGFYPPSPYDESFHGLTYGAGISGQLITISARFYDTSTGLVENGSPVSISFTYIDMAGPEILSINDSEGNSITSGEKTNLDVTLTAAKPDSAASGGIFQYSLNGESPWSNFNENQGGGTHTFSIADGSTLDCTNLQVQYYLDPDTFGPVSTTPFIIDKDAPEFPASPNDPKAEGDILSVSVTWYAPADSDLASISILKRTPAGSGEYTEEISYSETGIPTGTPNLDNIPARENTDIKLLATDDVGNTSEIIILNISPDTLLERIYVTPGGTGLGGTWESGMGNLQQAIDYAYENAVPEVWVMEGTYKPSTSPNLSSPPPGSQFYHYSLRNGVSITGGFAGSETTANPSGGATILSGYYSGSFGYDDAYHVFYHPAGTALNQSAVLKNVTITGGDADIPSVSGDHSRGGGMFNSYSSPLLISCIFSGNSTEVSGGAMYNDHSSPQLINCMFADNSTTGSFSEEGGAGVHNASLSNPVFINTIFSDNEAFANGGGVYNKLGSEPQFYNCTFHGNTANSGGSYGQAVYNLQSDPYFYNCLIWNTKGGDSSPIYNSSSLPTMGSNLIYSGTGPAEASDVFTSSDPANAEDFQLKSGSAAANAGTAGELPLDEHDIDDDGNILENFPFDFGSSNRNQGTAPDLGAWESF